MPTLEPHQHRRTAESFGVDADRYDRARPAYPQPLIDRIVAASPGPRVLDVGCGTGIVARQLRSAGCQVLGVDPDQRMAEVARRDGFPVEVARFEDWDPAGRVFDAVVAGQAWHWVDPVAGAAGAARALVPGGRLTVFWHAFEPPGTAAPVLAEALRRVAPQFTLPTSTEDAYRAMADRVRAGLAEAGGFAEPEHWRYDWEQPGRSWLAQLPTTGLLTRLPPEQVTAVLDAVGAATDPDAPTRVSTVALTARRT